MTILKLPEGKPLTPAQVELCERSGIHHAVNVGDKLCGIHRFAYTVGVLYGITEDVLYERRYCFEHYLDAITALALWVAHPNAEHVSGPWIKCKGNYFAADGVRAFHMDQGPLQTLVFMRDHYTANGEPEKASQFFEVIERFDSERGYPLVAGTGINAEATKQYKKGFAALGVLQNLS